MSRVVVTGLGAITPLGATANDLFQAALAGRSGITRLPGDLSGGNSALVGGMVSFDPATHWPARESAQLDRATQFALVAVREAIRDAELQLTDDESLRAGVYWGTGLGGAASI